MATATRTKVAYFFEYDECQRLPRNHPVNPNGWDRKTLRRRVEGPFYRACAADNRMVDVMGLATTVPGSMELHEELEEVA